jgi:VanZ family protein
LPTPWIDRQFSPGTIPLNFFPLLPLKIQFPRDKRLAQWSLGVVLVLIVAAGLDPREFRFRNEVEWMSGDAGLKFGRFGRVHTEPFVTAEQAAILNRDGFSLEAALSVTDSPNGGFRFLASFHAGDDRSQLMVGQWREQIIVMNGDDYSGRRATPRIAVDASGFTGGRALLTITTGPTGARIYLNGKEAAAKADLHLTIPGSPRKGRLVVGNSVHASDPWKGDVFGFAAYSNALTADQVSRHFAHWSERKTFSFGGVEGPFLLYSFDEGGGHEARDQSVRRAHLEIPASLVALERRALAPLPRNIENMNAFIVDVTVNLLGFVPFGFFLATVLGHSRRSKWKVILMATAYGFLLSFGIELAQAWMPSRDSSQLDLLMNTAGTLLGVAVALFDSTRHGMRT